MSLWHLVLDLLAPLRIPIVQAQGCFCDGTPFWRFFLRRTQAETAFWNFFIAISMTHPPTEFWVLCAFRNVFREKQHCTSPLWNYMWLNKLWSTWQVPSLSMFSAMITRTQSVRAACVALFTAHVRKRSTTELLGSYLDMYWKQLSGRVSSKMGLTCRSNTVINLK
jgi:hypothetical protein